MPAPYIFASTQTTTQRSLQGFLEHNPELHRFLKGSLPSLIDLQTYLDRRRSEVTFVLVFRDAEAAATHLPVARERLGLGVEVELAGDVDSVLEVASRALVQQARGLRRAAKLRSAGARGETLTGSPVKSDADSWWQELGRRRVREAPR